jgi:hypothetical protein
MLADFFSILITVDEEEITLPYMVATSETENWFWTASGRASVRWKTESYM